VKEDEVGLTADSWGDSHMIAARDLHKSLKSEVLAKANAAGAELVLVRLAWGKDDVAFSLHVAPNSWSTSGLQLPDLLSYIGFSRQPCLFLHNECFVREVDANLDLSAFGVALGTAYQALTQSQRLLESCGFRLSQPEGWGYFFGKRSSGRESGSYHGNGHTSAVTPERLKATEDDVFQFIFTWIKNNERDKGWTIHYRPKHPPLSVELRSVFDFLGICEFQQCPEFGFEPCSWRYIQFQERADNVFNSSADAAHRYFDAHPQNFSPGISGLLTAQATMEQVGMGFLPSFARPETRRAQEIARRVFTSKRESFVTVRTENPNFDVAISFAGTERQYAEELANKVKSAGFEVFYDRFFPEDLWGKNLAEFFYEIYSRRSRYCVIFVSNEYLNREWTVHERRSAQERMLKEKGNEYILPIKVEDVELPGIPSTIGYLPIGIGIDKIAEALLKKLKKK